MSHKLEIETAIQQLVNNYQARPYGYFSECELQYELFCIIKSLKQLDQHVASSDGVDIGTIHPEYPSAKRVQLGKGKGYRVWFDLAILNPDFIENNNYKTIWARDERNTKQWRNNLLAAFEFKYFPKRQANNISSVEQDCLKLTLCTEVDNRYVLSFSHYEVDKPLLDTVEIGTSKLYWITPKSIHILGTGSL